MYGLVTETSGVSVEKDGSYDCYRGWFEPWMSSCRVSLPEVGEPLGLAKAFCVEINVTMDVYALVWSRSCLSSP